MTPMSSTNVYLVTSTTCTTNPLVLNVTQFTCLPLTWLSVKKRKVWRINLFFFPSRLLSSYRFLMIQRGQRLARLLLGLEWCDTARFCNFKDHFYDILVLRVPLFTFKFYSPPTFYSKKKYVVDHRQYFFLFWRVKENILYPMEALRGGIC